jgi:hypothetical protein
VAEGVALVMNLTVQIPDDLASRLSAVGGDLARRALEAFALEEYKSGHITQAELRRLLGFWNPLSSRRVSESSRCVDRLHVGGCPT